MMKHGSFERNRAYIENEFENAVFDRNTGLDEVELYEKLAQIQDTPTEEPRQIVCAKAYAYLLDHVQLEINEHTPFSVKINIGVDYSSFAGLDIFDKAIFRKQREKFLEERFPEDYRRMKEGEAVGIGDIYTDFWHTVPNWERLIRLGFPGILKSALEVREALKDRTENGATAPTEKCQTSQTAFLDSVVICYQAILRLLERIYR